MIVLPNELAAELKTMRRDPGNFSVVRMVKCSLGDHQAFSLTHTQTKEAGTWCAEHGWLSFPSAILEPEWNGSRSN